MKSVQSRTQRTKNAIEAIPIVARSRDRAASHALAVLAFMF